MTAALLIAAACALTYQWRFAGSGGIGRARSAVKTAAVAALVVAGLGQAPALVLAGLALGAVGDFALSRPGTPAFLAGMAAFALGHLAYGAQFVTIGGWPGPVAWLACGALALGVGLSIAPRAGALCWPVRGYAAVICAMAAAATTLGPGHGLTQSGTALFVLSDLLLALELFVVQRQSLRRALALLLWPAYWAGQALILIGSLPSGPSILAPN